MAMSTVVNLFVFGLILGLHKSDGCTCKKTDINVLFCQADAALGVTVREVIPGPMEMTYIVEVWGVFRPDDAVDELEPLTAIYSSPYESLCGRMLKEETIYFIGVTKYNESYFELDYCSFFIEVTSQPVIPENWHGIPDCSYIQSQSSRRDAQAVGILDRDAFHLNALLGKPESQAHVELKKDVASHTHNDALDKRNSQVLRDLLGAFDTLTKKSANTVAHNSVKQARERKEKSLRDLLNDILR